MIPGWDSRYREILKEFDFNKQEDTDSAVLLDSMLSKENHLKNKITLKKFMI